MKNSLLIAKREILNLINTPVKFFSWLILMFVVMALFTGVLVIEKNTFPNKVNLNAAMNVRSILISFYIIWIAKKISIDLKRGYLKNLFVNNFSKQQYYFGTMLGYYFYLIITCLGNLILVYGTFADLGFPQADVLHYFLFTLFYFFLAPSIIFWIIVWLVYWFFKKEAKISFFVDLIIMSFILFSVIWLIITAYYQFKLHDSSIHWQNYLFLVLPYYNLIFAVPQTKELVGVVYWWTYIIDFVYSCLFAILYIVSNKKMKPTLIVNGKPNNKYF